MNKPVPARPIAATELTHNELITRFLAALAGGAMPNHELDNIFSGRWDQPLQPAMRHRATQRVTLIDLRRDGTFDLPV